MRQSFVLLLRVFCYSRRTDLFVTNEGVFRITCLMTKFDSLFESRTSNFKCIFVLKSPVVRCEIMIGRFGESGETQILMLFGIIS